MKCRILIDANMLLALYSYETPNLKLIYEFLMEYENLLEFVLTDIIVDEWLRNREKKIEHSIKNFKEANKRFGEPNIIKELETYEKYAEAKKKMLELAEKAVGEAKERARSKKLFADKIAAQIIEKARKFICKDDESIFMLAQRRMSYGNPPGKHGELGDRLTWEALLKNLEDGDLFILTDDSDFLSPLQQRVGSCTEDKVSSLLHMNTNEFLRDEWRSKRRGKLYLIRNWRCFIEYFSTHDPCDSLKDAKSESRPKILGLLRAFERSKAVERLVNSGSFKETHKSIEALMAFDDFSKSELLDLMKAYTENSQIAWIIDDVDVKEFAEKLLGLAEAYFDDEDIRKSADKLQSLLGAKRDPQKEFLDEDLPF